MVLGLENLPGLGKYFGDFDLTALTTGVGRIILLVLLFFFAAAVLGSIYWWISEKKAYNKKIFWFEEVHKQLIPIDEDFAKELTIPGTNVRVFYIKKKDLYLPRGTRRMGKDSYWYAIRNNKEIVNFILDNINETMSKAKLDFDHTDMRYAEENLRELIKRNYRDKATPWWREYKDVISTVILVFVMSLSFYFLLSKIGSLIGDLAPLINQVTELVKTSCTQNSGVIIQ